MEKKIEDLLREIRRVKLEIVMGDYNGHIMTKDYQNKLKHLEKQLKDLEND